ncbi:MAG: PAS domain S-box protein [Reyranella sp.]
MTDKFSLLAQMASDWWWEMDADLRFTFMSEQFTSVFGIPTSAVIGRTRVELHRGDYESPGWRAHLDDLAHRRPFRHFETTFMDSAGNMRPLWISGTPLFSEQGVFTGYFGVGHDLTELRRREREAAGRAAELESILENVEQGVVLFDQDMRVVVYNERLRDFLELDKSFDAHGMTLDEILHYLAERGEYAPEEKQAAIALRMRLMHSREPFTADRERQDGRIVSVHFKPLADGGAVMTYSDVTQSRRHDAQRRGLAEQLDRERKSLVAAQTVARVGSWETDLRTMEVQWSAETFRIFEVEPREFSPTHDRFLELVHPDDRAAVDEAFMGSLGTTEVCTIEHRIVTPSGKLKFVVERWQTVAEGDGMPARAVGTCQDCTELKIAQLKAEEATNLLRVAGRTARLGGWVSDLEKGQLEWSSVTAEIHDEPPGFSPSLEQGLRYFVAEDRKKMEVALDLCALEGRPFDETLRIVTARGRHVWVRVIGEAVRDRQGAIRSIRGALQDMTELLEARESSRRLAERLYQTLDNINDGFITIDADWRFTFVNQEAMRLLERSDTDLYASLLWEMLPDIVGSGFERNLREAAESQQVKTFVEYASGLAKWFSVRAYPSNEGLAIYLQDVTSSREQQEHLALLEAAVSRSNDIILITEANVLDEPGPAIVYANDAITKLTGYSPNEVIGKSPRLFQGPGTSRSELTRIRTALEANAPVSAELVNYAKNGSAYWTELDIAPIVDQAGRATHFVAVQRDITQRKAAQDALAISELRFRTVAQLSADIVWDWELASNVIWQNEEGSARYFRPEDKPDSPQSWMERIHPEDSERVLADLVAALRGGGDDWSAEYRLQRADGSYAQMVARAAVIRNHLGKAVRIVGSAEDVTEQRELQERVRHSEENYRTLFQAAPYAIIVKDRETHRLIAVNDAAVKQYGWSREEMLEMKMSDLHAAEDLPAPAALQRSSSSTDTSLLNNIRHRRKDGTLIDVEMAVRLLEYDGRPATLAVISDVSERIRSEREHVAAEEQLRASQRLDVVGKLTGGVAHDFNNILMVILANVDAVLDSDEVALETRRSIERIGGAAERASQLTRQLLAFSRKQTLRPEKTNLNDLVVATGSLLRRTLGEHIEINSLLAEDLWETHTDRGQVEAAVINLCINARDAMPDGGRLFIRTRNVTLDEDYAALNPEARPGDYVALSVTDSGTGMTPEVLSRAFEPFFTTKEVGKGTGLGLSMVYGFVKQSKGHVAIYSEIGHGTVVTLYLPKANREKEKAVTREFQVPRGTERILVVEDEEQVRAIVVGQLSSLGYTVVEASDGETALEKLRTGSAFDLLLTDVIMPGPLNGKALASEATKLSPDLRVLFMSGYSDDAISTLGVLNPGVSLLTKPFRKTDLAIAVRRVLEGTRQLTPTSSVSES